VNPDEIPVEETGEVEPFNDFIDLGVGVSMSPSIGRLSKALSKAQGAMQGAKKDSKNPFFRSTYADLYTVMETAKVPLAENDLAVVQLPQQTDGNTVSLITLLTHSSGEWIKSALTMIVQPKKTKEGFAHGDPQAIGSCISYARRYGLMAILGVCPTDDDGNSASNNQSTPAPKSRVVKKAPAKDTKKLVNELYGLLPQLRQVDEDAADKLDKYLETEHDESSYQATIDAIQVKMGA